MWARIDDESGCVAETTLTDPAGRYHPAIHWAPVPASLRPWVSLEYRVADDGVLAPPSLDQLVDQLLAKVAERGDAEATRGVVMPDGYRVDTSERGRTLLLGAYLHAAQLAQSAPDALICWKLTRREFESASAGAVMRRGAAALGHVQRCIDRERVITEAILAAPDVDAAIAAFDAAIDVGWP